MNMRTIVVVTASILVGGCATGVERGVIAMKISEQEAHIDLGSNQVAVGDSLRVFRSDCPPGFVGTKSQRLMAPGCEKRFVGTGTVTELLSKDYSIAVFSTGTSLMEGDTVEK